MKPKAVLNELEIKKLVREEIVECFKEISCNQKAQAKILSQQTSDIQEIKLALLGGGNKYKKDAGLSQMIEESYDFAKKNDILFKRMNPVVDHFEDWQRNNKWQILDTVIDNSVFTSRLKVYFGLSTFVGVVGLILIIIELIRTLSEKNIF